MPGVRVRADELDPDEIREVPVEGGVVRLTSPLRNAFDLARTLPLDEAVELIDAIGARHVVWPDDLRRLAHRHPCVRGRVRLPGRPPARRGPGPHGRLGELGWFVQRIPDHGAPDWLVLQALGLLERRRGRVRPPPLTSR
jgi:hypothetical protein